MHEYSAKEQRGWYMYDWANSAFYTTVITVLLGPYLTDIAKNGADPAGHALMYTPNPFAPGSSVSHWDTLEFPNQLMEPFINADLTHEVTPSQDMTFPLLQDIGW